MAQRSTYWSCTKFADWLRGTPKGEGKTCEEWRNWRKSSKSSHPFRYWLAEKGLNVVQNTIMWPIDKIYDIKYYVNNRWVTKTHCLTAHVRDIPRGDWRDVGNRFLPCLFNELQDFVEIELAWWHIAWEGMEERKKYNSPFWATGWFRWRTWRCPQAGLDNLHWQMSLKKDESWGLTPGDAEYGEPTSQAENAKEIYDLYKWWTEIYHNRPDPMDASGWTKIWEEKRNLQEDHDDVFLMSNSEEENKETREVLDVCDKIEKHYDDEDEQMLIRLIKIRNSLWT